MGKIQAMKSLNVLLITFFFIACSNNEPTSKNDNVEQPVIRLLSKGELGLIDYLESDTFDTKIAFSSTHIVCLNYYLGHASFTASSANLSILKNGILSSSQTGEVNEISAYLEGEIDSLALTQITVSKLVSRSNDLLSSKELKQLGILKKDLLPDPTGAVSASRNQVKKAGNSLFHLSYSKGGITELCILKDGQVSTRVLSEEMRINSPCMNLLDITGDGKKELFIFYPSIDYWDSESYELDIYGILDFY